jgi:signal transduction histidine kinase
MIATTLPVRPAASPPGARAGGRAAPRWVDSLLGVPLPAKLAGANAVIVLAALAAAFGMHEGGPERTRMVMIVGAALVLSLVVNLALVQLALRPLYSLEAAAGRVYGGDLSARVSPSPLGDREITRVGGTINMLLDRLTADRDRVRLLASEVIRAGDEERAYLARELHDSTAQTLAALIFQLSAASRDADPGLAGRLDEIKALAADVLEEVRMLSRAAHPRVLEDLGLPAALRTLAQQTESDATSVDVDADVDARVVPRAGAAVLYRVAQEALANAVRHGRARSIRMRLWTDEGRATLEVIDDGRGFDVAEAERRRPGMGLFTMRERVSLLDGEVTVASRAGAGTRVTAIVPLAGPTVLDDDASRASSPTHP